MKKLLCLIVVTLLISGCAWQRFPPLPNYNPSKTIPIRVGVVLGDGLESFNYGPGVVKNLEEIRVFNTIIFPYMKNEQVDGILKLDIRGGWNSCLPFELVKGFIIGFSMLTLSPLVGYSTTGTHDAVVTLNKGLIEVARYSVHVKTTVECGIKADLNEVDDKSKSLQQRKLAIEIARHINDDYLRISKEFEK